MPVTVKTDFATMSHLVMVHVEKVVTDEITSTIVDSVQEHVRSELSANQDLKQIIREETQKVLDSSLRKIVEEVVRGQQETK